MFGSELRILDVSSWLYIQFLMRNPIFRSKLSNSGVQRLKNRKNETRKCLKIKGLDFLSYDFLSYVSTVVVFDLRIQLSSKKLRFFKRFWEVFGEFSGGFWGGVWGNLSGISGGFGRKQCMKQSIEHLTATSS